MVTKSAFETEAEKVCEPNGIPEIRLAHGSLARPSGTIEDLRVVKSPAEIARIWAVPHNALGTDFSAKHDWDGVIARFRSRRWRLASEVWDWWALKDLNLRPTDYESAALTAELRAQVYVFNSVTAISPNAILPPMPNSMPTRFLGMG